MAIYTNLNGVEVELHNIAETSNVKSSIVGNIYDCKVTEDGTVDGKTVAVDNGTMIKVGDYTGNGLQERVASVATAKDKVAFVATPANIKDAFTKQQEQPYNFYNKAGSLVKAYELVEEDIVGVLADFVTGNATKGAYVVFEDGKYVIKDADPSDTYGFVGQVHSIAYGTFYNTVRILVKQNKNID